MLVRMTELMEHLVPPSALLACDLEHCAAVRARCQRLKSRAAME